MIDDHESDYLRAQDRRDRIRLMALLAHPDPRDPDYPIDQAAEDDDDDNDQLDDA